MLCKHQQKCSIMREILGKLSMMSSGWVRITNEKTTLDNSRERARDSAARCVNFPFNFVTHRIVVRNCSCQWNLSSQTERRGKKVEAFAARVWSKMKKAQSSRLEDAVLLWVDQHTKSSSSSRLCRTTTSLNVSSLAIIVDFHSRAERWLVL